MRNVGIVALVFGLGAAGPPAAAEETYRLVSVRRLVGDVKPEVTQRLANSRFRWPDPWEETADAEAPVIAHTLRTHHWVFDDNGWVVLRGPSGQPWKITLKLFDLEKTETYRVTVDPARLADDRPDLSRAWFVAADLSAQLNRANGGANGDVGRAWFQYRRERLSPMLATALSDLTKADADAGSVDRPSRDRIRLASADLPVAVAPAAAMDSFATLTGRRAIAENLQLDRAAAVAAGGERTVPLSEIQGLTVRPVDWTGLLDPKFQSVENLARMVPADHLAVFLRGPDAVAAALAEPDAWHQATLLAASVERGVLPRYLGMLGLSPEAIQAALKAGLVGEVAVVAGDPDLALGADVGVLVATPDAARLSAVLGPATTSRTIIGNDLMILSNSTGLTRTLELTRLGRKHAVADTPDFKFFRRRYGGDGTDVFAVMTDDAIRRWGGPRWRIAQRRRLDALASLARAQCLIIDGRREEIPLLPLKDLVVSPDGVTSKEFGTLAFVTPEADLDMDRVTPAERDGYLRWRDGYQSQWRRGFDPVGVGLRVRPDSLAADVSVFPLIDDSDYHRNMQWSLGRKLKPTDGDWHPEVIAFAAVAVNRESPPMKQWDAMAKGMLRGNGLEWLGGYISVYAEADPFWEELARQSEKSLPEFWVREGHRLPIGVTIASEDSLKLAGFLLALRAAVESGVPNLLVFGEGEHAGKRYSTIRAVDRGSVLPEKGRVYYTTIDGRLVFAASEAVIKRALERAGKPQPPQPWLGESAVAVLKPGVWKLTPLIWDNWSRDEVQSASWRNLPILNEWKRKFPDADPLAVHRKWFGETPLCAAGGRYVWNAAAGAMESTVAGRPGDPRGERTPLPEALKRMKEVRLGITFENNGIRSRIEVDRTP